MEKNLTTIQVRNIAEGLLTNWDNFKNDIKLNGSSLYHLIALKRTLTDEEQKISDTLIQLFTSLGCEVNEQQNGFIVTEDKQAAVNEALNDFYKTMVTLNYNPIVLTETDSVPTDLIDILFDFIEFKE